MSFKKYLLDKTVQITVSIVGFIIAILMLNAFKVENDLKIALTILFFLVATFNIIFDYFRKYKFYKKILNTLDKLDNYIDQILYFVRSENAEKDYLIKEIELQKIIKDVALKNKDDLLENKVNLEVDIHNEKVLTDSKWLEFVLNQIINNSIKYKKNNNEPIIKISVKDEKDKVYLTIWDNGIGIPKNDIKRVFDKSFTGENGRIMAKSTGMGLYIVKKLCDKLGHKIIIESEIHKYTKITIIFYKNDFYKVD